MHRGIKDGLEHIFCPSNKVVKRTRTRSSSRRPNHGIDAWEIALHLFGHNRCCYKMVNAIKGLFISCDIPMAQFIINLNASQPPAQRFIIHVLDSTHLFVQPHVAEMIRSAIAEFREQNSYEKPA